MGEWVVGDVHLLFGIFGQDCHGLFILYLMSVAWTSAFVWAMLVRCSFMIAYESDDIHQMILSTE